MEPTFSFYRAPASSVIPYKQITLVDVYRYIVGPYAALRTTKLRAATEKKTQSLLKRTLFDYCTFSGTFTRRTDADLIEHSGYLCIDFDHLQTTKSPTLQPTDSPTPQPSNFPTIQPDSSEQKLPKGVRPPLVVLPSDTLNATRNILLKDPHFETLLLFVSPSGTGLKWVISIDLAKGDHRTWFNAVRNYLLATYHLNADPACVNVSRSCFLPHDPNCYIAPRLLPELQPIFTYNPAALQLMSVFHATNIDIK